MAKIFEPTKHSIAIIGMACVYPGSHSPEELWQNVLAGRRFFRRTPPERLPLADYYDADMQAPGKTYCDQMAVITDWTFDPLKFRIPPSMAEASDITHWLALSTAFKAVRDANVDITNLDRTRVGVVLGNTMAGEFARSHYLRFRWPYVERVIRRALTDKEYGSRDIDSLVESVRHYYESPLPEITEDSLPGNMANTIAARICNYFDLGGGGYVVDGACSSSLLAVAMGCNHLANGDMDLAITGGVDISLDPFELIGFAKVQALASDDIYPYDNRAAGMLTGEGCGIVVLVREEDAIAAGYKNYALIRGWGYSTDGSGGITAPAVEGQVRALRRAYQSAGYPISCVDLIEGHGTGTVLGDKVEINAIRRLLSESPGDGICWIGSIKGNIGHCKAAAGVAGLIKAAMALNRKILPPTVNCEQPSAAFGRPLGRLRPCIRGQEWEKRNTPRRASVSAMGFGGSNCHISLQETNPQDEPCQADLALLGTPQASEVILLAAVSRRELTERVQNLITIAERICRAEMTDLAAALAKDHPQDDIRLAVVARSPQDLAESLKKIHKHLTSGIEIEAIDEPLMGIFAGSPSDFPRCVALFPGQGSQHINMGADLLLRYSFLNDFCRSAEEAIADILPDGLVDHIWRPVEAADDAPVSSIQYPASSIQHPVSSKWETELRDTRMTQPAIVLSSLAILQVLKFLGLEPHILIGHSLGEISALGASGACDNITAVRIAALRGRAIASLHLQDPGAMAVLAVSAAEAEELIKREDLHKSGNHKSTESALAITNYNSPRQTVVSGSCGSIKELLRVCKKRGVRCSRLPVSHAFHSHIVAPAVSVLRDALTTVSFQAPSQTVISTSTGHRLTGNTDIRDLLSEHICRPVRFIDAVLNAHARRPQLWIEVGPGDILTGLVRDILGPGRFECFPTDVDGIDSFHLLNNILARAYVVGFPIAVGRLFEYRFHRPFPVDDYTPLFIVNPCERPVQPPGTRNDPTSSSWLALTGNGPDSLTSPGIVATEVEAADQEAMDDAILLLTLATDWISRRTGFPKSSIGAETKLRDHLNLDSIKTAQLVLLLSQRLGREIPSGHLSELDNASLGQMIDAVIRSKPVAREERSLPSIGSLRPWIRTFRMEEIAAPIKDDNPLPMPTSGSAAVVAEPGCPKAHAIANRLRQEGFTPIVSTAYSLFDYKEILDTLAVLVVVLPENTQCFLDCTPIEFSDRVEGLATSLFLAFGWPVHWREGELDGLRCLVLRPVSQPGDPCIDLDAGSAFLKSLKLEYPNAELKWVHLPAEWSPEHWAELAIQELQNSGCRLAFGYDQNGIRTSSAAVSAIRPESQPPDLGVDDVVLATGGAKGITFELAFQLARTTKVKLALLGSSEHPDSESTAPENEMLRNFQRLCEAGIHYTYVQCDVTDLRGVRQAVIRIERDLGIVSGVLHGAGISNLHRFRHMDLDECLQCIRVKAQGLYNILSAICPDRLKMLHVISSVLGKTGMRSQSDYAMANAWLDGALHNISSSYPRLQCLSLGYSLWSETGMNRKLDLLMDLLFSMGVTAINTKDGVNSYLDLVQHPRQASIFVISGRLTPELESGLFPRPNIAKGRYLERVIRCISGTEIVAEASLSHQTDLYLPEHVFQGTPIFPGVMAIEAMVEAAMACVDSKDLPVLQNIRFVRALIIPEDAIVVVRVLALADPPVGNLTRVQVAVRAESDGFGENYFSSECVFGLPAPASADLPCFPDIPERIVKDPEDFTPTPIFQGEFFRRITAIRKLDIGRGSITEVCVPVREKYYANHGEQLLMTPSPAGRDAFFQSGAIALPAGYLPVQIAELRFHQKPAPGSMLICQTKGVAKSRDSYVADIAVFTADGQLAETISGIVLREPGGKTYASTEHVASVS